MLIKKVLLYLVFTVSTINCSFADENFPDLSEDAQISLITGSPGDQIYAIFGHSAIRVYDPKTKIDWVYNYGTFDFNAPGFYENFLKGKLNYFLSVYDFQHMLNTYQFYNQSLYEQVLNLNLAEKNEVFKFLNNNYLPENRYYLYDFFFDNCSSRIRDVFEDILKDKLTFTDQHISNHKTFRQLLDEFIFSSPWGDFGMDLALGMPADATATSSEYMYLPFKLFDAFEYATIRVNKSNIPFVKSTNLLVESINTGQKDSFQISPKILFWTLAILIIAFSLLYRRKIRIWNLIDAVIFSFIGLTGIFLLFLWFGTEHIATKDNYDLLWASPFYLIIPFLIFQKNKIRWPAYFFLFWSVFLIIVLAAWNYLPQQLNTGSIPIIIILLTRSFYRYKISLRNHVGREK